jgi:hypothetical protein
MTKALQIILAALLISTAAVAQQAATTPPLPNQTTTGVIVSINAGAMTVTLDDGQTFVLPAAIKPSSFGVGAMVIINFAPDASGVLTASSVTAIGNPMPSPAKSGSG